MRIMTGREYIVEEPNEHSASWRVHESIVRCRDCTCYKRDEIGGYCTLFDFEDVKDMDSRFCAWGERRDA